RFVSRRFNVLVAAAALACLAGFAPSLRAQTNPNQPTTPVAPPARTLGRVDKADIPKEEKKEQPKYDAKNFTPTGEQVAETVMLVTMRSPRPRDVFKQIRRNGVERGQ